MRKAQLAKRCPIIKQKRAETLNECLLSNEKRKNMHYQLNDGQ